ncbi:MAG TPA: formate dehydrogenase accessory protein FdhE [Thermoanaerobaculia bacterium]|nr:formate dehydrogenase accessory protein FdhE [Thermoanaerobaculia bacterium]
MTPDVWLQRHPYLGDVARFAFWVDGAVARLRVAEVPIPAFGDHAGDFQTGIPLVQSSTTHVDLEPAGAMAVSVARSLAEDPLEGRTGDETRALDRELREDPEAPRRIAGWLLGDDAWTPASPGLLRYLGWTAAARYLRPLVAEFSAWRDEDREERWQRAYCPTCGSAPAMAQLAGKDPGRRRLLCCGCCRTRWQFPRTACPFCEADAQRLTSLTIEGEGGLRLDHCPSCGGYLKTYDGEGDEALLLADWSSLHLDVLALDRGWKRAAASLYELPAETANV